jgi:hypothetical protein
MTLQRKHVVVLYSQKLPASKCLVGRGKYTKSTLIITKCCLLDCNVLYFEGRTLIDLFAFFGYKLNVYRGGLISLLIITPKLLNRFR